jgi:hypothetical protein
MTMEIGPVGLNTFQKRQAALLYHFTSSEYLEGVIAKAKAVADAGDSLLDKAGEGSRDDLMLREGWLAGDLSENWSTYAHPMLQELMRHLFKVRAVRAFEKFENTGVSSAIAGLLNFSNNWMLPDEEERYRDLIGALVDSADPLDSVLSRRWNDLLVERIWEKHRGSIAAAGYRVREDVRAESGKLPPRTGVYVPIDDSFGTLQFAWTGDAEGSLRDCVTLSDLAREYCDVVGGRGRLWLAPKGHTVRRDSPTDRHFARWCTNRGIVIPDSGAAFCPLAFEKHPAKWCFVERIEGASDEAAAEAADYQLRGEPGSKAPRSGWWYTPAIKGEQGFRYFEEGTRFPDTVSTEWGQVIWQFDPKRQPK